MGNWFLERRLDYIDFRLVNAGSIRREDLIRTFGITIVSASNTLSAFRLLYPNETRYDKSQKRYVPRKGYKSLRGMCAAVESAMYLLNLAKHPMGWR